MGAFVIGIFFRPAVMGAFVLGIFSGVCLRHPPSSWIEVTTRTKSVETIHGLVVFESSAEKIEGTSSLRCHRVLRLAFTVMSSPDNNGSIKRALVRGSWPLKNIYKVPPLVEVTVLFVLGTKGLSKGQLHKLTAERSKFGDIVLLPNHHDTYNQLTEKVRQTIQWADKNLQFDYLIKTDDDVVIRLDKMVDALRKIGCPERLYWGHFMINITVDQTGKWKETNYNACSTYLPYVSGTGYVLGRQVVQLITKHSEHLRHFLSEDVSMGFWLAPYQMTRVPDRRFYLIPTCYNVAIQAHQQGSIENLRHAILALLKRGKLC